MKKKPPKNNGFTFHPQSFLSVTRMKCREWATAKQVSIGYEHYWLALPTRFPSSAGIRWNLSQLRLMLIQDLTGGPWPIAIGNFRWLCVHRQSKYLVWSMAMLGTLCAGTRVPGQLSNHCFAVFFFFNLRIFFFFRSLPLSKFQKVSNSFKAPKAWNTKKDYAQLQVGREPERPATTCLSAKFTSFILEERVT